MNCIRVMACALLLLSLPSCRSHESPESLYRRARSNLRLGNWNASLREVDADFRQFDNRDLKWAWRFRVLKAEVLARQGRAEESLSLLKEEIPISMSGDESAVRRKLTQCLA